ncbi:MAG: type VI secretion system tip protein VgrG, partial [Pseudomonas sp.]
QQVHLKAGANLILDAGASITLKGGGQHIVIGPGGIFSSTEIQLGGAPMLGAAALQATPTSLAPLSAPLPSIATPLPIVASAQQQAADYCPLCEACRNGLCSSGEHA